METLTAISRWLAKQHVVTWCVQQEGELWCANAFYLFDAQKVAFYILTEEKNAPRADEWAAGGSCRNCKRSAENGSVNSRRAI
ncbi:conserved protein, UPF0306 family [Escherichia coli]|uniref:Conserved protein, UPF0306 family n=1 Tax=Escherichia coli TaxID=562 RepID=A0A376VD26_ECOLX|nr:conserved protein, UPF0306 family [Escherichia coli]